MSRKVLVTGASGFIGSHVVENLVNSKFDVTALVHYNSRADVGWLNDMSEDARNSTKIIFGDVTDTEQVSKIVSANEITVNLAALIAIPYSYQAPRSYMNTNLLGTMNICEAVKNNDSELVQFSTSEVYGTPSSVPITEEHHINPQSPYAASKSAADQLCISYFRAFDLKVNILRPFNTFGPRQSMRAIIPTIINQFIANEGKINVGNLEPKRDFTYVEDTARAVTSLINSKSKFGEVIQLGTGVAYSVREIIELCEEISGIEAKVNFDSSRLRPEKSEVEILLSNPKKASNIMNWQHQIDFKEGLTSTFKWFELNKKLYTNAESYFI